MPLTISAEANTDVLIMKKGSKGNATISYQLVYYCLTNVLLGLVFSKLTEQKPNKIPFFRFDSELTPHSSSSSCKDVQESTYDKDFTTSGGRLKTSVGGRLVNYPLNYGPKACINVNGKYFIRNDCVEDSNPDPWCYYGLCFYCMKVEGFDEPKWFWYSPDGEWILVTHSGYVMNQGKN
ncbi:hypothetical protein Mgra_00002845 [Meloidogyne graminicola]|uniref:Uncharacterized protein n=1 Tax=Meloidogyne graminicola TaxID=189291 RepID=A0A8S9ZVH6_9BILA|nr:hypothetical protein Mgra_00002845 [Meloidogyne graminicola]